MAKSIQFCYVVSNVAGFLSDNNKLDLSAYEHRIEQGRFPWMDNAKRS